MVDDPERLLNFLSHRGHAGSSRQQQHFTLSHINTNFNQSEALPRSSDGVGSVAVSAKIHKIVAISNDLGLRIIFEHSLISPLCY